jgi:hypothetical protein
MDFLLKMFIYEMVQLVVIAAIMVALKRHYRRGTLVSYRISSALRKAVGISDYEQKLDTIRAQLRREAYNRKILERRVTNLRDMM